MQVGHCFQLRCPQTLQREPFIVDYCTFIKLSCLVEIKGTWCSLPPRAAPHQSGPVEPSGAPKAGPEEHATKNLCESR